MPACHACGGGAAARVLVAAGPVAAASRRPARSPAATDGHADRPAPHEGPRRAPGRRQRASAAGEAPTGPRRAGLFAECEHARRGRAGRRRGPLAAPGDAQDAGPAGRGLRLGEGVGGGVTTQPVGLRGIAASGGQGAAAPAASRGRAIAAEVHQPRHGGVPRPRANRRGLPGAAGRTRVRRSRRRDRVTGLPPGLLRRPAGPGGLAQRASRCGTPQGLDQDQAGQGCGCRKLGRGR